MNVTDAPSGILDPKQPYWPADKVNERTWLRLKGKLTGRSIPGLSENFTSYVKLGDADADKLIANIKKYGQYPQVNQNDKYGGAYNNEEYQKWLVEEFLEKPFQQQTNQKIEDAAIESRLKEIQEEKKQKATSFISGATSFRPGKKISPNVTKMQGIIPKRSIPSEVSQKISSPVDTSNIQPKEEEDSSSFGRLLLNFVQINNDLDAIKEVIEEDFKTTKEKNKQEVDEYKKRVANRGRKLTKKELGSDKKSVTESIKPFISNFFSGAGGAIRSLALLKMLLGILNGDISSVFKGLFGIGLSFLPKIGMMIAGGILKNLLASMAGRAVGGGISRGVGGGMRRAPIAPSSAGFGKWAKIASLGTGALALGSAFSASNQDQQPESSQQSETQKKLEELTVQQKSSPEVSSIAQEDLKKFETLNIRFEKALEFFIETYKKTMEEKDKATTSSSSSSPASPGPSGPVISSSPGEANLAAFVSTLESSQLQDQADVMQSMTNRAGQNYSGYGGLFGQLTAREQYSPLSAAIYGTSGDTAASRAYGGVAAKLGKTPEERKAKLQQIISQPDALPQLQTLFGRGNASNAKQLLDDFYSGGAVSKESQRFIQGRTDFGARSGVGGATGSGQVRRSSNTFGAAGANMAPSLLPSIVPSAPSLPQPAVQPSSRSGGARALSGSGSQSKISVTVVPVPSNKPGAVTPNSGTNLQSIDPNYSGDIWSSLTGAQLNLVVGQ